MLSQQNTQYKMAKDLKVYTDAKEAYIRCSASYIISKMH